MLVIDDLDHIKLEIGIDLAGLGDQFHDAVDMGNIAVADGIVLGLPFKGGFILLQAPGQVLEVRNTTGGRKSSLSISYFSIQGICCQHHSNYVEPAVRKSINSTGRRADIKELSGQLKNPFISVMTRPRSFLDNKGCIGKDKTSLTARSVFGRSFAPCKILPL